MNKEQHIYFIGIGGIGMSALARYYARLGYVVTGYDLTESPLTRQLVKEGISIHYHESPELIPAEPEWVVYTPAIPESNKELQYCRQKGMPLIKRAALLGKISSMHQTVAVGGTHGKTSITALITHLLYTAHYPVTAFIGGIARNFDSNLVVHHEARVLVIEADEFDRSFLQLHPAIAIISSMDADHLDIYGDHQNITKSFVEFAHQCSPEGSLIVQEKIAHEFGDITNTLTYGIEKAVTYAARNIRVEDHQFVFDLHHPDGIITHIAMRVPGKHYIENALAAAAAALQLGIEGAVLKKGLETYLGVERRFEYRVNHQQCVYIDDYAHHPEEIRATIEAIRQLYPDKAILGIFQPHLYSRTRDFAADFATALSALDTVAIMDIYPAREEPMEGVNARMILDLMSHPDKHHLPATELSAFLKAHKAPVIVTMGAGSIGLMTDEIIKTLES